MIYIIRIIAIKVMDFSLIKNFKHKVYGFYRQL